MVLCLIFEEVRMIKKWVENYNSKRPKSGKDYRSPIEAWMEYYDKVEIKGSIISRFIAYSSECQMQVNDKIRVYFIDFQ